MNLFHRVKTPRTPQALLLSAHPELAGRIVGAKPSHIKENYWYVFVDNFQLPAFVVSVTDHVVEAVRLDEPARACLLRASHTEVAA